MSDDAARARLWEVDLLRTAAMVLMVAYHVVYDLDMLSPDVRVDPFDGPWRAVQVACGSTFLAVAGISFWIATARARGRGARGLALWRRGLPRALEVLAAALLVTIATRVALGAEDAVRFGILHLIGVLMLLVLPLAVALGRWNLLLGAGVIVLGVAWEAASDVPGAMALGWVPGEQGVDWYPLVPWAGPALIGLALGAWLYPDGRRGPRLRALPAATRGLVRAGAPGRHSLPFYLVHQPVLLAVLAGLLALAGAQVDPS